MPTDKNARRLKESRRAWCLKYSLRVVENYRVLLSENRFYALSGEGERGCLHIRVLT